MIVTTEYLEKHKTKRGSWTKQQIQALGLTWPPRKGWIKSVQGLILSNEQDRMFREAKYKTTESKTRYKECPSKKKSMQSRKRKRC